MKELRHDHGIFDALIDHNVLMQMRPDRYELMLYNIGKPIHANWMIKLTGEAQQVPMGSSVAVWFDHALMTPTFTHDTSVMWNELYAQIPALITDTRKMEDKWVQITGRDPSDIPEFKDMDPKTLGSLPNAWEYAALINQNHLENIETSTALFKASWMLRSVIQGTSDSAKAFQEDFQDTLKIAFAPFMDRIKDEPEFSQYFRTGVLPDCDISKSETIDSGMYFMAIDALVEHGWNYARVNGFDSSLPFMHLRNVMDAITKHTASDTMSVNNSFFSHVESCIMIQTKHELKYKGEWSDLDVHNNPLGKWPCEINGRIPVYEPEKLKLVQSDIRKLFEEVILIHHTMYGLTEKNDPFTAWVVWMAKQMDESIDQLFTPPTTPTNYGFRKVAYGE